MWVRFPSPAPIPARAVSDSQESCDRRGIDACFVHDGLRWPLDTQPRFRGMTGQVFTRAVPPVGILTASNGGPARSRLDRSDLRRGTEGTL